MIIPIIGFALSISTARIISAPRRAPKHAAALPERLDETRAADFPRGGEQADPFPLQSRFIFGYDPI
jgi:hypothetical protein